MKHLIKLKAKKIDIINLFRFAQKTLRNLQIFNHLVNFRRTVYYRSNFNLALTIQLILILSALNTFAQTSETPFVLTTDTNWHTEIIEFPLGFAPDIKFEGYEDLRFLKDWKNPNSNEFWSYGFAWILNKDPEISASQLSKKVNDYYNGLMKLNPSDINDEAEGSVQKSIRKTKSTFSKSIDAENNYTGVIETLDAFFTKEPLRFNVQVESSYCEALQKYIVLFRLSPKGFEENVWKQLKRIKPVCE